MQDPVSASALPATPLPGAVHKPQRRLPPGRAARAAGAVDTGKATLRNGQLPFPPFPAGSSRWCGQAGPKPSWSGALRRGHQFSGSVAAIAPWLAPLTVCKTETGRLIVSPASACGNGGIKPNVAGQPFRDRADLRLLLLSTPRGRSRVTVADAAALLTVMAGPARSDPSTDRAAAEVLRRRASGSGCARRSAPRSGVLVIQGSQSSQPPRVRDRGRWRFCRAHGAHVVRSVLADSSTRTRSPRTPRSRLEFTHDVTRPGLPGCDAPS